MADTLKNLLVVLFLAMMVFASAGRSVCSIAMSHGDYVRRRNLWIGITVAVFIANNFWVYIAFVGLLLAFAGRKEHSPLALFFFVLFAVPMIHKEVGGFGSIQLLFAIEYGRLLALLVLLPAFIRLRRETGQAPFGRLGTDKLVLGLLLTQFLLIAQGSSITNALRIGIFYPFLGIFLPYFVASRSLRSFEGFREVMTAYVAAAMVLSAISFFEGLMHWLLYTQLEVSLGVNWGLSKHLVRGGSLRAIGSTGQPIALGFAITVAIGFHLYLRPFMPNRRLWAAGMAILGAGLVASLSRGPWTGAAVLLLVFILSGPSPMQLLFKFGGIAFALLLILLVSPFGARLGEYLPWFGTIERTTIDYRESLLEKSIVLIMKNPIFGDRNFLASSSEMQDLAIGTGFIDIVNTYVRVALTYGLTGLAFFAGCFLSVIAGIFNTMRRIRSKAEDGYRLGQILLSVLVSIAVMIGTVSSITVIPLIYWSAIGMGAAYILMIRRLRQQEIPDVNPGHGLTPASQGK
jgi:O-antigen ligase